MSDMKNRLIYLELALALVFNVIAFARIAKLETQIRGADFLQGPAGPQGPEGPMGLTGPAGMPGINGRDGDSASAILPPGCPRLTTVNSNLPDAFGNGWHHQVVVCW